MASKLGQSLLLCYYYVRLNHCVSASAKATWFWMLKTCVHVHVQTLTTAPNLLGLASFPARQVRNSGLKPLLCFLLSELGWDDDAIYLCTNLCCTLVPFPWRTAFSFRATEHTFSTLGEQMKPILSCGSPEAVVVFAHQVSPSSQ